MFTFRTIVCSVDFSEHSRVALARAGAWARHFGARLIVVTVTQPLLVNAAAAAYDMDLVRDEVLPELRDFVTKTADACGTGMPPWEAVVVTGEPATEIVALARREHAHLIVIATHGLSGYRKMLLGSTAEKVLRQTGVPVLVEPPAEQVPAARGLTDDGGWTCSGARRLHKRVRGERAGRCRYRGNLRRFAGARSCGGSCQRA